MFIYFARQLDENWKTRVLCKQGEGIPTHSHATGKLQFQHHSDIMAHEIDEAISRLKSHSAPGLDKILPIMMTHAGPKLLVTYQACWSQGNLPDIWKGQNQIYLPKKS
jgi:hypothetical protein